MYRTVGTEVVLKAIKFPSWVAGANEMRRKKLKAGKNEGKTIFYCIQVYGHFFLQPGEHLILSKGGQIK